MNYRHFCTWGLVGLVGGGCHPDTSGTTPGDWPLQPGDVYTAPAVTGEASFVKPSQIAEVSLRDDLVVKAAADQVLLAFSPGAGEDSRLEVEDTLALAGWQVIGQLPAFSLLQIQVAGPDEVRVAIDLLQSLPDVAFAAPNLVILPSGPTGTSQPQGEYWQENTHAEGAWAYTHGGVAPIAVVDTGVATTSAHFASRASVVVPVPGLNLTNVGQDESGHGTAVAALATARGDDGFGSRGVAWDNPLYVVDVSDNMDGSSTMEADLLGIYAALDAGAKIVVHARGPSLGGVGCATGSREALYMEYRWYLSPAIAEARAQDALVFVSAGNQLSTADGCPANLKQDNSPLPPWRSRSPDFEDYDSAWAGSALVVASTDRADLPTWWTGEGDSIALAAPGEEVTGALPDGSFSVVSGTSYSTPMAAGAGALVYGILGGRGWHTKEILQATARPVSGGNVGAGVLDIEAAVELALLESDNTLGNLDTSDSDIHIFGSAGGDNLGGIYCLGPLDLSQGTSVGLGVPDHEGGTGAFYLFAGNARVPGDYTVNVANLIFTGEAPGDNLGFAASPLGDVDGDNQPDWAVSAPWHVSGGVRAGRIYAFLTSYSAPTLPTGSQLYVDGTRSQRPLRIDGREEGSRLGYSLTGVEDINGDGLSDMVVGAPGGEGGRGAVYIYYGVKSTGTQPPLGTADLVLMGEVAGDEAGASVGYVGDYDGDGRLDLFVGAPGQDRSGTDAGKVYLYPASTLRQLGRGRYPLADAPVSFVGEERGDRLGEVARMVGDVDGDTLHDFALGNALNDEGGTDAGAVYLFLSSSRPGWGQEKPVGFADYKFVGDAAGDHAGASLSTATDLSGDGLDEWMVGAPNNAGGVGAFYVISGLPSVVCRHGVHLSEVGDRVPGERAGDHFGRQVDGACDFDADGKLDFMVAAPGVDLSGAVDPGEVYIFTGPMVVAPEGDILPESDYPVGISMSCHTAVNTPGEAVGLALMALVGGLLRRRRGPGLALMVAAAGCSGSGQGVDSPATTTSSVDSGLSGVVTDVTGKPIVGAEVSLRDVEGIESVTTNGSGEFSLPLPPDGSGPVVLMATAEGFTRNMRVVSVEQGQAGLTVNIPLGIAEVGLLEDAALGGRVTFDRVGLDFPPGALVDGAGEKVVGVVEVWLTDYFPGDPTDLPVPSMFSLTAGMDPARFAASDEQEVLPLATYGMLSVELFKDGIQLEVDKDANITLELLGYASRTLNPQAGDKPWEEGDRAPLFHLPEDETVWELWDDVGWSVQAASDGSETLSFVTEVPHFSYWNLDVFQPATKLTGDVFTVAGDTTVFHSGVEINVRGVNRSGGEWHTYGWSNAAGHYCIRVGADTPDVEIWFEARFGGVQYKVREYTSTNAVTAEPACDSELANIYNHEIPCEFFEDNNILWCLGL